MRKVNRPPTEDRVLLNTYFCPFSGCWLWTGYTTPRGYSFIQVLGKKYSVHRLMWVKEHGVIPPDKQIDHLCRNRNCINPDHLELVTSRENTMRGISFSAVNAKKTHCVHGHEFTPENVRPRKRGGRECLACRRRKAETASAKKQVKIIETQKAGLLPGKEGE